MVVVDTCDGLGAKGVFQDITPPELAAGIEGEHIDKAINSTLVVDAEKPDTVYTNSGYDTGRLYKSTNGGVDWNEVWPPPSQPELATAFTYQFVNILTADPNDSDHLLLTLHEPCLPPHPDVCIAETHDGGDSWVLMDGDPSWVRSAWVRSGAQPALLDQRRIWRMAVCCRLT